MLHKEGLHELEGRRRAILGECVDPSDVADDSGSDGGRTISTPTPEPPAHLLGAQSEHGQGTELIAEEAGAQDAQDISEEMQGSYCAPPVTRLLFRSQDCKDAATLESLGVQEGNVLGVGATLVQHM